MLGLVTDVLTCFVGFLKGLHFFLFLFLFFFCLFFFKDIQEAATEIAGMS